MTSKLEDLLVVDCASHFLKVLEAQIRGYVYDPIWSDFFGWGTSTVFHSGLHAFPKVLNFSHNLALCCVLSDAWNTVFE